MANVDSQLFLVILLLPALFAMIFIAEGVHKMMEKEESPLPSFVIGITFLGVIIAAYLLLFAR